MANRLVIGLIFLLISFPAFAETTGVINFSFVNVSVLTGLAGYTVNLCNTTSGCLGHTCFLDYDNFSSGFSYGWCNSSVITSCFHNNSEYSTGTNICVTNLTTRSCSSGTWQGIANCSSGQTCPSTAGFPGNCTTSSSSSSSSSSGSSSSTNTSSKASSIIFTSYPLSFEIVQGESTTRVVIVQNNGNTTLYNITLSSSSTWLSVRPVKWNQSVKNNETAFTLNISIPADAAVKAHTVTLEVTTHNASLKAGKSFDITVKPSNKTVQEQIFPDYDRYLEILAELETTVSSLGASGANVEEVQALLLNARSKLSQANQSLESKDYFTAQQLLGDAKGLLDAASTQAASISIPGSVPVVPADFTLMIIMAVIAGVIVFVVYLLLPPGKSKPASSFFEKSGEKKKK